MAETAVEGLSEVKVRVTLARAFIVGFGFGLGFVAAVWWVLVIMLAAASGGG